MSNPVTFRKINIFLWFFFKTISTRSENAIFEGVQRCYATAKKVVDHPSGQANSQNLENIHNFSI